MSRAGWRLFSLFITLCIISCRAEAEPKPEADPQHFIGPLSPFYTYYHPFSVPYRPPPRYTIPGVHPALPASYQPYDQGGVSQSPFSPSVSPVIHNANAELDAMIRNLAYQWAPFRYMFLSQNPSSSARPSHSVHSPNRVPFTSYLQNDPLSHQAIRNIFGLYGTRGSNPCSRDGFRGTCAYTPSQCKERRGTVNQYCPDFTKICCIFKEEECHKLLSEEVSYIQNSQHSNLQKYQEPCPFSVMKISDSYCTLRVSFDDFRFPSDCSEAGLEIVGVSGLQKLCGRISDRVYDIDIRKTWLTILNFQFETRQSVAWRLKLTQLKCGAPTQTPWPSEGSIGAEETGVDMQKPVETGTDKKKPTDTVSTTVEEAATTGLESKEPSKPTPGKSPVAKKSCGVSRKFSKGKKPLARSEEPEIDYEALEKSVACSAADCPVDRRSNPLLESDWWSVPTVEESELYENAGTFNSVDGRITFGKKTKQFDYPWQVAMYVRGRFHCGASVISPKEILTAAHCVQRYRNRASAVKLSVGDYNVKSQSDGKNLSPGIDKIIVHPGYSTRTLQNDIAIIRLKNPLTFSERVHAACLPPNNINLENEIVTVTGWGRDENNLLQPILMEHSAAVLSNTVCNNRWKPLRLGANLIKPTMMCMDPQTGDSCKGDSGGPCVTEYPKGSGKFTLVGVVSFGSASCTDKKLPGVYTRVGAMVSWIKKHVTA